MESSELAELIERLGDDKPDTRKQAATALRQFGPEARESVPALIQLLSDSDAEVRGAALIALSAIDPAAKRAALGQVPKEPINLPQTARKRKRGAARAPSRKRHPTSQSDPRTKTKVSVTVAHEWALIGITVVVYVILGAMEMSASTGTSSYRHSSGFGWMNEFITLFAHGMWMTMDRRRRGLVVGWWRFSAIVLGPIAIWAYFVMEYGVRSLYLIPISLGIYLVSEGLLIMAVAMMVM